MFETIAAVLCFFPCLSPQETVLSTRQKECDSLEAEVKKKNQTCQTLVSASEIDAQPLSERLKLICI